MNFQNLKIVFDRTIFLSEASWNFWEETAEHMVGSSNVCFAKIPPPLTCVPFKTIQTLF